MKESKMLKTISYIILPILVGIIILSIIYTFVKESFPEMDSEYLETVEFEKQYIGAISRMANELVYIDSDYAYYVEDNGIKIYYADFNNYSYIYGSTLKDNYVLLIYKDKAITNIKLKDTTTLEQIKDYIKNEDVEKLDIVKGKINENPFQSDINSYKGRFEFRYYYTAEIKEVKIDDNLTPLEATEVLEEVYDSKGRIIYETSTFNDFEIYGTYKKEDFVANEFYEFIVNFVETIESYEDILYFAVPVCSVLVLIIVVYLIISIGHTEKSDKININDLDKIPLEIFCLILLIVTVICFAILDFSSYQYIIEYYKFIMCGAITLYLVEYTVLAIVVTTIVKRIKGKMFWKTTIIGSITIWIYRKIKRLFEMVDESKSSISKFVIYIIIYVFIMIFLIVLLQLLGLIIDIIITGYIFTEILKNINSLEKIENHLKDISEGKTNERLDIEKLSKEHRKIAEYINGISNGYEKIVQEGIKSERLKTELITNVSHDIKTPLTSIIKYVDLLKKENINSEKAKEYIEILDVKSQRLKRLTEDLVEASKASSGNVKLNLEKINVAELINQSTGEFEDRFKEKNLQVIIQKNEESILIEADSRYMYRVIENLFSNIAKYAAENSRVYIDIISKNNKVNIAIKNISKDKLNISTDELMQRFVRGDKSRTTEGSGLRTFNIEESN